MEYTTTENFNLVVAHYGCPPGEVVLMKAQAAQDRERAIEWFALLADEIRAK